MKWRGLIALLVGAALTGCDRTTPPPAPAPSPSPGAERITGSERLGWNQPAGDTAELASFSYAIYVDGARSELGGVSCEAASTQAGHACGARLPALSTGPHTLELAAFILDAGAVVESSRSAPLQVIVGAAAAAPASLSADGAAVTSGDGVRLRLEWIATGLDRPSDLGFAEDGRIFIAERAGRVCVVRDGRLLADPALELPDVATAGDGGLLALAVDPAFGRTGFVYVLYTTDESAGVPMFRLARFRDAGGTLAERAILLDGVPASPDRASAALRFGADGRLHAALDDGGDAQRAGDLASFNGKLLRLNGDGTTPGDQRGATPVSARGFRSPRGLDWDPGSGTLWVVDEDAAGGASLRAIGARPAGSRLGTIVATHALPPGASALVFYRSDRIAAFRGDLFVALDQGRHLLRLRVAAQDPLRIESAERLLDDRVGGVRAVAVGPDGAIYFCTARALARLVPE
jgi:glucose/arabinose dehydrogenase